MSDNSAVHLLRKRIQVIDALCSDTAAGSAGPACREISSDALPADEKPATKDGEAGPDGEICPDVEWKLEKLLQYRDDILAWNEKVNLTAIKEREAFLRQHYIDAYVPADHEAFLSAHSIIDVGTGGGFPGVPLAILFPRKQVVLLDALKKRLRIIEEVCLALGIDNVVVVHGRAEEIARQPKYRGQFDLCVSRAVASLPVLSEYCLPLVRKGGWFCAYKGSSAAEELASSVRALRVLGAKHICSVSSPYENDGRKILMIRKDKSTPKQYPRSNRKIVKDPL